MKFEEGVGQKSDKEKMKSTMINPFGVSKLGEMTLVPWEDKAGKTILFNPENKVEAKEQL